MRDAKAIQARLDAIFGEMSGTLPSERSREELASEYEQLAASLPKTGMQAGTLEITGRRLSSGFIPRPDPPDAGIPAEIADDPVRRYLWETGQAWE